MDRLDYPPRIEKTDPGTAPDSPSIREAEIAKQHLGSENTGGLHRNPDTPDRVFAYNRRYAQNSENQLSPR